jgi:hypothetical protein
MSVHLIYTGADGQSYLAPLDLADTYDASSPPISSLGWRTIVRPGQGPLDPPHVAKGNGSIQMIAQGRLRIGVSAGALRRVIGGAGDVFIFVDTHGVGHAAQRIGDLPFQAFNIRLSDDWDTLSRAFTNWPADAVRCAP